MTARSRRCCYRTIFCCTHLDRRGYGLSIATAMAFGTLPVVASKGAHTDFTDLDYVFTYVTKEILCTKMPCSSSGRSMPLWQLHPAVRGQRFVWFEANPSEIAKTLIEAYNTFKYKPREFLRKRKSAHLSICQMQWGMRTQQVEQAEEILANTPPLTSVR